MATHQGNSQVAYDKIRQAIVEGRYPPGQRLVEQRIGAEFALSRTPVREALRRLEAEGLVHSVPNRGAVVRSVSLEDVSDLYGLRARLEAYGAELAAERNEPEQVDDINNGIAAFEEALRGEYPDELERVRAISEANRQIHEAIQAAAHHERLALLLARTVDVPLVFQAFRQFDESQTERSHVFHQLIRDAIVAGDGARASTLMHEHVMQGRDVLIVHLESHTSGVDDLFDAAPIPTD